MSVAKDMELSVVTRENLVQFLKRSIKEKGGGRRSGGGNDDDVVVFRQLLTRVRRTRISLGARKPSVAHRSSFGDGGERFASYR